MTETIEAVAPRWNHRIIELDKAKYDAALAELKPILEKLFNDLVEYKSAYLDLRTCDKVRGNLDDSLNKARNEIWKACLKHGFKEGYPEFDAVTTKIFVDVNTAASTESIKQCTGKPQIFPSPNPHINEGSFIAHKRAAAALVGVVYI